MVDSFQNPAIIGGGRWGLALFSALQAHHPTVTSRRDLGLEQQVPLEQALESPLLIIAISAQALRGWFQHHFVDKNQSVLIAAKGIEVKSGAFLDSIAGEFLPHERTAFLAGPSFAKEVEKGLPTAFMIHSVHTALADQIAALFPPFIKTYSDSDVTGGEIAGAYKNVIAIAAGICDGLKLGQNAKAALVARGLVEMTRFGMHFGAKESTFLGLSGAGDLFLTSNSTLSRNYRVGIGLAEGQTLDVILEKLGEVAEGVATTEAVVRLADTQNIHTPIAREVQAILLGKNPKASLRDLLS